MDRRFALLSIALVASCGFYLFWGLGPRWQFILGLRAPKLIGMLLVGAAIAVATMVFQTVCRNRILTPQIMGFDALYILMQTAMVAVLGISGYAGLSISVKFGAEVVVMTVAALLLFGTLLGRGTQDVARLVLTGVILGVLFRSFSTFLARIIDPNAFAVVQAASFASFTNIEPNLLPVTGVVCLGAIALSLWLSPRLDVLALGRPIAISLGLSHDRLVLLALVIVAVLVAVSTALVGPIAFFGLLVSGLAHELTGSSRHARLLPMAILVATLMLVAGQTLFERVLGLQSTLSVVIEFAGGLFFLWLLLKGRTR
ncbi:iron chelate uptake ABC transporter family permease subunit [Pacificibacter marinus]|uniref:iron chelate uptake ABC transporter family permease subunit n=1 Tax=Pacificibacter marinus TaxID=658057 RepID=UPI001C07455D|nr:iron chelate uptake ABC transporter family permease subunit [Pacificibacter marinus]MBU2865651.1 iron chelate uptake ABC transporter family permease subunit [Pacificibacter marinus]